MLSTEGEVDARARGQESGA